jgi:hypothetical protein
MAKFASDKGGGKRDFGTAAGAQTTGKGEGNWQSALPERERQALLSGRREKNLPEMDEEVKNYFKKLAE